MSEIVRVGRRKQTTARNRQLILDAARLTFCEVGYEAANLRVVMRRTGLASGTFYNYFRSKEHLFAVLQDDALARFRPLLAKAAEDERCVAGVVRGALLALFRFGEIERQAEAVRGRPARKGNLPSHIPGRAAVLQLVEGLVADALSARMDEGRAQMAAAAFSAAAQAIEGRSFPSLEGEKLALALADLLLGGLRQPVPGRPCDSRRRRPRQP